MSKSVIDEMVDNTFKAIWMVLKFFVRAILALLKLIFRGGRKEGIPGPPNRNAPGFALKDALVRACCAVVAHSDKEFSPDILAGLDKALAELTAFHGTPEAERLAILYSAFKGAEAQGINVANGACEIIGNKHGREMLHLMNHFVRWMGSRLPMKDHLMWHLNTAVGVSVDEYARMWDVDQQAPPRRFE